MDVNKVVLTGNVGVTPNVKYFDNEKVVAIFSLYVEKQKYTDNEISIDKGKWYSVVSLGYLAKIVEKSIKRGMIVFIEGKTRSRAYKDTNGVERHIIEIIADNVEIVEEKNPEYYYLFFSKIGGMGYTECLDCNHQEEIVSFLHGFSKLHQIANPLVGMQCQSCGKFDSVSEDIQISCDCGGMLSRDKALFCPKCKSKRLKYTPNIIA